MPDAGWFLEQKSRDNRCTGCVGCWMRLTFGASIRQEPSSLIHPFRSKLIHALDVNIFVCCFGFHPGHFVERLAKCRRSTSGWYPRTTNNFTSCFGKRINLTFLWVGRQSASLRRPDEQSRLSRHFLEFAATVTLVDAALALLGVRWKYLDSIVDDIVSGFLLVGYRII